MKNSSRFRHLFTLAALMISIIGLPTPTPPADHAIRRPIAATHSLGQALNPDGTLNLRSGFSGSFDAHGWRMTTTADGTPRFVAAGSDAPHKPDIAGDEWWDSEFQIGVSEPGYAAYVYAIAVHGSDVYFGGYFSRAGGIDANNIVRFNTTTQHWYPLGNGTTGTVNAILVSGNSVYIGCNCNDVSGISVGGVARWDTISQSWSGVGAYLTSSNGQFSGVVNALALDGSGRLIVGGYFDHAGTVPVMNIARWDGTSWSAIGSGIGTSNGTDEVYALAASGDDIYAGGYFTYPTSNIAHWNGSTWLSDMGGTNNMVRALLLNGSTLYVGGDFTQVGLLSANRIAVWNGTYWSALGAGVDNTVRSIALGPDGLYIGGLFTMVNGNSPVTYIAVWSGSGWAVPGSNLDGEVDALAVSGGDVYMGGNFTVTDGGLANHLARWSVPYSSWYSIGNAPNGEIFAVAISGSDVYVGGVFNSVGGIAANNIAKWNSGTGVWSALGGGLTGCTGVPGCVGAVYTIAINGTDVYAGGTFTTEGEYHNGQLYQYPTGPVIRWDTLLNEWEQSFVADPYSPGVQFAVYALAPQYNGVVIGGSFLRAPCGSVSSQLCVVNNVVFWDGHLTYHALTDGVTTGTNGEVHALFNDGYGMYLGGNFSSPRPTIVYFDGYDWFGEGSGLNGTVDALAADNNYLYAGGSFINAAGSGADHIARLHFAVGANWEPMGASLDGPVTGFAWSGSDLIAVGRFNQSGLLGLNNIARWSTTAEAWSPLGSGISGLFAEGFGVAATNQAIYVAGGYNSAGGKESDYLARWAHFQTYLPSLIK